MKVDFWSVVQIFGTFFHVHLSSNKLNNAYNYLYMHDKHDNNYEEGKNTTKAYEHDLNVEECGR